MKAYVVKRLVTCATGVGLCLAAALGSATAASTRDSDLCADAAGRAARETGVPRDVLLAITLTETGRAIDGPMRPWPWAVNVGGEGHWFGTRSEAVQFVDAQLLAGTSNFDVGCFQLNHRWHGDAFASTNDMFDPAANALYAARYLKSLEADSGDWSAAAGAYHSATPANAEKYRDRFDHLYAGLASDPVGSAPIVRVNRYPLLQRGGAGAVGSLVPMAASSRPLIGD